MTATPPRTPDLAPGTPSALLRRVVDALSSVPLALGLLIALAVTSIFGTVILQQGDPAQYQETYGAPLTSLIRFLDLDRMYHSWWFLVLLGLLLVNITLCSAKRFPRAWSLMTGPAQPLDDDLFRRLKYRASLKHGGDAAAALEAAGRVLAARVGRPARLAGPGGTTLTVDRGWYGRLGVYITHLSILILAVGVLMGGMRGYRGDMTLVDRAGRTDLAEGNVSDRVEVWGGGNDRRLPFSIRCDRVSVEYYEDDPDQVKDYFSDLTVLEGGREVMRKRIEVNSPLRYKGRSFFQSNYGVHPASTVTLEVLDRSGRVAGPALTLRPGQAFTVLNDSASHRLVSLTRMGGEVLVVKMSRQDAHGGGEYSFRGDSRDFAARMGWLVTFRVKSADIIQYTGLQVSKDPGVPVIWLACVIMIGGLYVTFFVAHQRVWVRVDDDPASPAVLVAGTTSRNPLVFEREFEALREEIRQAVRI